MASSKITEEELLSRIQGEITDALGYSDVISEQRAKSMDYYYGLPFGNEVDGRSQYVDSSVMDTIEWIKPSLMRVFASGEEMVRFNPIGPEDVESAEQATDYVNYIFTRDNNGWEILYTWFTDALLQKNGIVKCWWDETEEWNREEYNNLEEMEFTVLLEDDDVEVLEWHGDYLEQVGYKNTGNRTMAIAAKEEFIYSAEWASIQVFEFGEISNSDIDLSTWELNYPYVENGASYSLSLDIINNGNTALTNIDNYTTNSEFIVVNPLTSLGPGEIQTVEIIYNASNSNASGAYRIYSNDPDEPEIICETNGNIDGANVGEPAPDFELNYVANGTGSYKLSDHLGEIVVLAFFAPN